jgi:DNA oxidative demethylase
MTGQLSLLETPPALPEGMRYEPGFVSPAEERALVEAIAALPFAPFQFRGFEGKRRTVSFGHHYDFNAGGLKPAAPMPPFLLRLRERAARFVGLEAERLSHALVIEYGEGAGIGWHRDRPVFDKVVGVSLRSPCTLRFRRRRGDKWQRLSLTAEPRSAYLLTGPARTEWEHSIPEVETLRYSVTFRSLKAQL